MHVPSQPFDAISAFAVPNPNCSSQSQSVFSGLAARPVALPSESLSLLRVSNVLFSLTLSAVDESKLRELLEDCQRLFSVQLAGCDEAKIGNATVESLLLKE